MVIFESTAELAFMKNDILTALKEVIDPEMHVNIVDLGLVYSINLSDTHIKVEMTLTSRYCPMGDSIISAANNVMARLFAGFEIEIALIWEPAWNYDFITPAGLQQLRGK